MSMILSLIAPAGGGHLDDLALLVAEQGRPTGDSFESRLCAGSASAEPTIS